MTLKYGQPIHETSTNTKCPNCGFNMILLSGLGSLGVGQMLSCPECHYTSLDVMQNIKRETDANTRNS